jgi:hypothetical protein
MTADQIKAAYARVLQEPIVVRRYTGPERPALTSMSRSEARLRNTMLMN